MRTLSRALLLVTALIATAYALHPTSARASASLNLPTSSCYGDRAEVGFSWSAAPGRAQWLDLSLFNNGFAPGSYLAAGPLDSNQQHYSWGGIITGAPHYWRVTTQTSQGWLISATGTFVPCGDSSPRPPASAISYSSLEQDMMRGHATERAVAGIHALVVDESLSRIARMRANDMAASGYFSHTSPRGETAFSLLGQFGISYGIAGENIARNNYPDSQSAGVAVSGLMASATHRDNVLSRRFTRIGIGVAVSGDMKYYALVYAGP